MPRAATTRLINAAFFITCSFSLSDQPRKKDGVLPARLLGRSLYSVSVVRLNRTVRFAINPSEAGSGSTAAKDPNGYGGSPSLRGLGAHYELEVSCRGEIDPVTSYLLDIKTVDKAVRDKALPLIERALNQGPKSEAQDVLAQIHAALGEALPGMLESVRWKLTPYHSLEMTGSPSSQAPAIALLRQKFDFAAAHRLHLPNLSPGQNRALFGKCNNPTGHGHNYQFEPCVEVPAGRGTPSFSLQDLERIAQATLVERFDHKHLNTDTPEFDLGRGGVNPTVENIAKVFFELLSKAIAAAKSGAVLRSVTVWETDRTSATYPA
jgi:6-pyruvoyltetrahydropterin/6-carboxytetrahydropterin synthase